MVELSASKKKLLALITTVCVILFYLRPSSHPSANFLAYDQDNESLFSTTLPTQEPTTPTQVTSENIDSTEGSSSYNSVPHSTLTQIKDSDPMPATLPHLNISFENLPDPVDIAYPDTAEHHTTNQTAETITSPQNRDLYLRPPSQEWIQAQFQRALTARGVQYARVNTWSTCGMKTYYFHNINTIFTGIPKTGCSNWIEVLLRAEGALTYKLDPTEVKKVHGKMSMPFRIPKARMRYSDSIFREAFSFTVLRNPWTRMVSGYRDKLSSEDTQGADKRSIGIHIVSEMRGIDTSTVKRQNLYPTFAEYAEWLARHDGHVNVHFEPQYETLCVPKAKYDMVVPLEYTGPMGAEVLKQIDADNAHVLGSYDKSSDPRLQKSALYAKEWLSELDGRLVEKLYQIFKTDFELLNYSNFTHPDFPLPLYEGS